MKKRINMDRILKRLEALNIGAVSDVPELTFIEEDGDKYSVVEHYLSPRKIKYVQLTVDKPDDYEPKGGIIYHGYGLEN